MSDIAERLNDPRFNGQEGMRREAAGEIARLRDALMFYADEARWTMNSAGITPAMDDRGHRARTALDGEQSDEIGDRDRLVATLTGQLDGFLERAIKAEAVAHCLRSALRSILSYPGIRQFIGKILYEAGEAAMQGREPAPDRARSFADQLSRHRI